MSSSNATIDAGAWPELAVNQEVILEDERGDRIMGTLDGMTLDRTTLWVQLLGGLGRRLVHHQDGYSLRSTHAG